MIRWSITFLEQISPSHPFINSGKWVASWTYQQMSPYLRHRRVRKASMPRRTRTHLRCNDKLNRNACSFPVLLILKQIWIRTCWKNNRVCDNILIISFEKWWRGKVPRALMSREQRECWNLCLNPLYNSHLGAVDRKPDPIVDLVSSSKRMGTRYRAEVRDSLLHEAGIVRFQQIRVVPRK